MSLKSFIRFLHNTLVQRHGGLFTHRDTPENNPSTPFKFSPENRKRIAAVFSKYPEGHQRGAMLSLFDLAQRQHGWLPLSAMHEIAKILKLPRMRVYEVATFYSMINRNPMGKWHVRVCTCTPCWLVGSDDVLAAAESELGIRVGETTADGMFTLSEVECQGACVNGPVMVVRDNYYEDLQAEDAKRIIAAFKECTIPRPGPQRGRYSSEPVGDLTSLCSDPPGPGHGVREDL